MNLLFIVLCSSFFHHKEGGVVRGKYRWISSQNRRHGRMSFEFLVQELPDQWPAPPFRVIETRVKGKVPFIECFCFHLLGFRSILLPSGT